MTMFKRGFNFIADCHDFWLGIVGQNILANIRTSV
jgi:hypothetical protein